MGFKEINENISMNLKVYRFTYVTNKKLLKKKIQYKHLYQIPIYRSVGIRVSCYSNVIYCTM